MGIVVVFAYLVWSCLLVWLYLWIGEARFWRRYDRERRQFATDQHQLLAALRLTARKETDR